MVKYSYMSGEVKREGTLRRVLSSRKVLSAVIAVSVGLLLLIYSLVALSLHTTNTQSQNAACSTSCGSHNQPVAAKPQAERKDENDKEPVPPQAYWQQLPINLAVLYVAPVAYYFFVYQRKKVLLTTQLRF